MKKTYLFILVLFLGTTLFAQLAKNKDPRTFTVMFYNVENLFDTIDHPDFEDEEFTPGSEKEWTYDRYKKKLTDISRVINSVPGKELPAVIGFSEVENIGVLEDLINTRGLRKAGYKAVLEESDDPRGIDVGLIYREEFFKYESHEILPVNDLSKGGYKLRGILHVKGKGPDKQTIHFYVNHWKSRWGGVKETENYRIYAGITMRRHLDYLMGREQNARYVIMGDFNDEPTNRSLHDIMHAGSKRSNPWISDSYNLMYDAHNYLDEGTIAYKGEPQMYDQIILSYSLLNQDRGLSIGFDGGKVLKEEWMIYHDEKYNIDVPNRTYGGPNYYGGISDHFPVYAVFTW